MDPTCPLLSGLADELSAIVPLIEGLATLVFEHATAAAPADRAGVLTQAQAVDDLSQRLVAVRDLMASVARGEPVDSALQALPLAEMAARLRRVVLDRAPEPGSASAHGAGELMLFD